MMMTILIQNMLPFDVMLIKGLKGNVNTVFYFCCEKNLESFPKFDLDLELFANLVT